MCYVPPLVTRLGFVNQFTSTTTKSSLYCTIKGNVGVMCGSSCIVAAASSHNTAAVL